MMIKRVSTLIIPVHSYPLTLEICVITFVDFIESGLNLICDFGILNHFLIDFVELLIVYFARVFVTQAKNILLFESTLLGFLC